MKTFKLLESAIIGILIGVVVSVYILFMDTIGRDFGTILKTISLTDIVKYFPQNYQNSIVFNFIFYIGVYTIYIILFNILFRIHKKTGIALSAVLIVVIGLSIFQQVQSFKQPLAIENSIVETANLSNSETIKKYFGDEVRGDLNNDNIEDVAFLIRRNEGDERGDMYYLSASLKVNNGYEGLNLIYVGEKIFIDKIEIQEKTIIVSYRVDSDFEEVLQYKARVDEKVLMEIEEIEEARDTTEEIIE